MAGNHHNMAQGHLKCNNSLIWLQNLQNCEKSQNDIFLQVRGHQNVHFVLFFSKAIFMGGNHHNMIPGHLKCNNSPIWLQNLQNCEKCQNDIFLQVRGHRKLQIFFFCFSKALFRAEIYHNMTPGHLKCNNSLIWLQNLQKIVKSPKTTFFLQVRGNWKPHFFIFSKALFMARNSQVMTPGHLNCNNSLIWLLNQQNYKKSQNNIFLQIRGHRKLRFFLSFQKPFYGRKSSKYDTRTPEM